MTQIIKFIATKPRTCIDCERMIEIGQTGYKNPYTGIIYCEECHEDLMKPFETIKTLKPEESWF